MHATIGLSTKTALLVVIATVSSVGCAIKPVRETALIPDSRTVLVVARDIEGLATQCWQRAPTMLSDGIRIDARLTLSGTAEISATRYARDIGLQNPFFIATVFRDDMATQVRLEESDYACHLTGNCYSLDYTSEVRQWLQGRRACVDRK